MGLGRLDVHEVRTAEAGEHLAAAGRLYRRSDSRYWLARVDEARTGLR